MNELADRLAAAAEEVTSEVTELDYQALRERVRRTSRRLGQRRVLAAALTVLAVTGATVGGVRLLPEPHSVGPAGGPSTPAPHKPSDSSDNPGLPPDATNGPLGTGALVYVSGVPGQDLVVDLIRGDYPIPVAFGTARANDRAWVVSPDLTGVALVDSPDPGSVAPGDLVVLRPGGGRHTLAHQVVWTGGDRPQWTPDSKKIMVRLAGGGWSLVDIGSGTIAPLPGLDGEYLAWSTNHAHLAYVVQRNTVVVARPDGTVTSRTPLSGLVECHQAPACPFAVQAVSDDGRYVALGHGNTDAGQVTEAHIVLDTRSGQAVALPKVTGQIDRIYFRPDGGMLLRSYRGETITFFLVGRDLKVTTTFNEASFLSQYDLVAYYPQVP